MMLLNFFINGPFNVGKNAVDMGSSMKVYQGRNLM